MGARGGSSGKMVMAGTPSSEAWAATVGSVLTREAAGWYVGGVGESGVGQPLWQWQGETPGGDFR